MPPADYTSGVQERLAVVRRRLGDAEVKRRGLEQVWKQALATAQAEATDTTVGFCAKAYKLVKDAEAECARWADAHRALQADIEDAIWYGDRYQFHLKGFRQQYTGMGYQYEVLIERAAWAAAQADLADRTETKKGQREAAREVRESVAALQKYTEATKQAVLQKVVNDEIGRVILVFERVFRDQSPALWEEALLALRAGTQERTA